MHTGIIILFRMDKTSSNARPIYQTGHSIL